MRLAAVGNIWDEFGVAEVVGTLIENEHDDSDGDKGCEDSEDDVEQ